MPHDFGYYEEEKLGRSYDARLARRLLPFIRPYGRLLSLAVLLVVAITLLDLFLPYVTKIAIDRYIVPRPGASAAGGPPPMAVDAADPAVAQLVQRHPQRFGSRNGVPTIDRRALEAFSPSERALLRRGDLSGVGWMAALFLGAILLHFALTFLQMMLMEYTGQMVMHDLRMHLFAHIQDLSATFFSRHPVGRLVTRLTNDVQNMYELFTSIIVFVFKDVFLLFGITLVLLGLNWRLALVSFTVLPLVMLASAHFATLAREAFRTLRVKVAEINTRFSETISGIRIIQLFLREERNFRRFEALNHENYLAGMRQIHLFAIFMPVIEVLASAALALVIFYGGGRVMTGDLSLGSLVAFISYMRMFFRPMRDIAEKYNVMQNAMASAERIFLLLDNRDRLPAPAAGQGPATGPIDEVRFDGVSFAYVKNEPVIRGVSFALRRGETVAVVGPTGAGKTTLIHLLLRFYDPDAGDIRINGEDLRTLPAEAVRKRMALVMQDPFLFSASIRDNIAMGGEGLDDADLSRLVTAARCGDLVARLPRGMDTVLSEGGLSISSGERQLVSIARAMARNPDLILLDEATSYIDSDTERRVQEALGNLMQGRTTLLIAHRLSTARHADRILVMHKGAIIESGTHPELMARRGFYFRLNQIGA